MDDRSESVLLPEGVPARRSVSGTQEGDVGDFPQSAPDQRRARGLMFPFSGLTAGSVVLSALFGFNMIYSLSRSSPAAREKFLCLFFFLSSRRQRSRVSRADLNVSLPRFFFVFFLVLPGIFHFLLSPSCRLD